MSNTIDNRVVEMQFDNSQFEKNVATSMSTLDKLKQKLNFQGATKGLESVGESAKKVNFSPLETAADGVRVKLSALQVAGITALQNITNTAIGTGKKVYNALFVDPKKTGLQEYETQIGAIQTILANTQHQGTNLQQVNKALDELNTYADKTIYNFTEMTRNIGTFTAAGIDLRTSTDSIKGIANLAAVSGSTSQQASTAMYQLSQALAAGKVSLMDWNSVVNAGMGGKVFQDALIRTSELLGTNAKDAIKTAGSFRESLTESGWLTTEVLTETLKQFAGAYDEADLIAQGFSKKQAKNIAEMAKTAEDAATQVKTFSQLWDTLKESAQSGWTSSWEIMIGDFDEAKTTLTEISNSVGALLGKQADARNKLLSEGLSTGWKQLLDQGIGDEEAFIERIEKVARKSGDSFDKIVKKSDSFTEALQKGLKSGAITSDTLSKAVFGLSKKWSKMSQEELKAKGYTSDMVKQLNSLSSGLKDGSISMDDFVKKIMRPSGRQNIIDAIWNSCKALMNIITPINSALRTVFPKKTGEELYALTEKIEKFTEGLVISDDNVEKIRKTFLGLFSAVKLVSTTFSTGLKLALTTVGGILKYFDKDLLDVTAGLGTVLQIFSSWYDKSMGLIGKGTEVIMPVVTDMAKAISEYIRSFTEMPAVSKAIQQVNKAFDNLKKTAKDFKEIVNNFSFKDLLKYLDTLTKGSASRFGKIFKGIGTDTVNGLVSGLAGGAAKVATSISKIADTVINTIKSKLGIHSPSTVMYEIGSNIIQGLYDGITAGVDAIIGIFSTIYDKLTKTVGSVNWSQVFVVGSLGAIGVMLNKFINALNAMAAPLEGFGDMMSGAGKVLNKSAKGIAKTIKSFSKVLSSFSKVLGALAFEKKTEGIKNLSISLAILVGSIAVLTLLDMDQVKKAVAVIGVLAGILAALAIVTSKVSTASLEISKESKGVKTVSSSLVGTAAALLIMAKAAATLGKLTSSGFKQGLIGLIAITGIIAGVMTAFWGISHAFKGSTADFALMGASLLQMSMAMIWMTRVVKAASKLDANQAKKGAAFAGAFVVFVGALVAVTKVATGVQIASVGGLVIAVTIAMGLMVHVVKSIGKLTPGAMIKGLLFVTAFTAFVAALTGISVIAKAAGGIQKISGLVLSVSIAMALMVGVCKLVNKLKTSEMIKGAAFAAAFIIFIKALTEVTTISNQQKSAKLAGTIIAMSIAITAMAGMCVLLGMLDIGSLAKGVVAVGIMAGLFTAMLVAAKNAEKAQKSLIVMTVAIGLLTASVVALSFIKPERLVPATLAMSMLMGVFALMELASKNAKASLPSLLAMLAVIGVLTEVVIVLSKIKTDNAMPIIKSIAALGVTMAAALVVFGTFGELAGPAIVGAAGAVAVIGIIGGVAVAIGALMSKLKPSTISKWQEGLTQFMEFIRILAQGLGEAIGSFIGGIGVGMSKSMVDVGNNMSQFVISMTPFFSMLKTLDKGTILSGVGTLIAVMLGIGAIEFINAITSLIPFTSSIGEVSTGLTRFALGLIPFSNAMKMMDEGTVSCVTNLGKMIAALTASSVIDGIAKLITGKTAFAGLGDQLSQFADAIIPFSKKLSGANIDEGAINAATNVGKMIAALQKSMPKSGGLVQTIFGENDWTAFNSGVKGFGSAIVAFNKSIGSTTLNESAITTASNAGDMLATLQSKIPKSGGWLQNILGQSDWAVFNDGIKGFGDSINAFNDAIGTATINEQQVTTVTNAGKALAAVQAAIPENKLFDGKADLSDFGKKIVAFGKSITDYSSSVGDVDTTKMNMTVNVANRFATLSQTLTNFNSESFDKFKIDKIGTALINYSKKVEGFNPSGITSSIISVNSLIRVVNLLSTLDTSGLSRFNIMTLANSLKAYSTAVSGINAAGIQTSISLASRLKIFINNLGNMDTSGVDSFKTAVSSLSNTNFSSMTSAFSSASAKMTSSATSLTSGALTAVKSGSGSFGKAGRELGIRLVDGFSAQVNKLKSATGSAITSAVAAVRAHKSGMRSAGVNLGEGLVSGINSKKSAAYNAGYALGKAAVDGEKAGQKSHSPSKLTIQAGQWLGEGLVIGMERMGSKVYSTGENLGRSATNSMTEAVSKISDFINTGMDAEPTIRPVLDLTDVQSGVSMMGGMLDMTPSVGVTSNIGAINTMMAQRNQNGSVGTELASAIRGLRRDLSDNPRNVYNVNGVTYDDGTNVSTAVGSLIRAAKIERRV